MKRCAIYALATLALLTFSCSNGTADVEVALTPEQWHSLSPAGLRVIRCTLVNRASHAIEVWLPVTDALQAVQVDSAIVQIDRSSTTDDVSLVETIQKQHEICESVLLPPGLSTNLLIAAPTKGRLRLRVHLDGWRFNPPGRGAIESNWITLE